MDTHLGFLCFSYLRCVCITSDIHIASWWGVGGRYLSQGGGCGQGCDVWSVVSCSSLFLTHSLPDSFFFNRVPDITVPHDRFPHSWKAFFLLDAHSPAQLQISLRNLRPVWRKCLHPFMSPHACPVILSVFSSLAFLGPQCCGKISFKSPTYPSTSSIAL